MSKYTAIKRTKLSAPMQYLYDGGLTTGNCLDYGCGRGFDCDVLGISGYDPFWRPLECWLYVDHPEKYDRVFCNYVLNVVTIEEQKHIIDTINGLLDRRGLAFYAVRRDIKEDRQGRGCIQRAVVLSDPFKSLVKNSSFEIYLIGKQ